MDSWALLAGTVEQLSAAARYMSRPSTSRENLIFILFAMVIAIIWAMLFFWDRFRKLQEPAQEVVKSLFDELCEAHRLSQQDAALLVDAAQECRLSSPAILFVQPEHLALLSGEQRPKGGVYGQLREKLFGKDS
jgi:hypothetical protein